MRKTTIKTILASALLALPGSALAEGTDGIAIDDVTILPGQTQSVTVSYSFNDLVYHGFEVILVFPDDSPVHIVKNAGDETGQEQLDCSLSESLGSTGAEFTLYSFDNGDDGYLFRSLSLKSNTIPPGDGELFSFTIEADADAVLGTTVPVTVKEARFAFRNDETEELEWKSFDSFTFNVTFSDRVILDENSTKAPQASNVAVDVTVLRTINLGEWSTLCLPFTITYDKVSSAFSGMNVEVAEFKGFEITFSGGDDISPDAITLQFKTFTPSRPKPIRGGWPYLIRLSASDENEGIDKIDRIEVDGVTISPNVTEMTQYDDVYGFEGKFVGTLAKTVVPEDALFLSGNKFWYSTGKTNIKAFRGWFELEPVLGKDVSFSNVGFMVDSEPVSVTDVGIVTQPHHDVYTVQGQLVGRHVDLRSLPSGIYIVDGKKMFIK